MEVKDVATHRHTALSLAQ
uniref:Uncharacterized protein n=1 Tax=Arundo donax TaxID=35708 RepID=A0A0A9E7P0_ARUDO